MVSLGFTLENREATDNNDFRVNYHSQDGAADTDDEVYFFNGHTDVGIVARVLKLSLMNIIIN
ncbi:hypothetical protein FACS1894193_06530 [Bacilli bacterium]|nr:hypothetical protein FACS1894192_12580 [Bacilli bacterium]GHU41914.1 hypothetical protein FACS1894193_06530 [Bacilli bacterium]